MMMMTMMMAKAAKGNLRMMTEDVETKPYTEVADDNVHRMQPKQFNAYLVQKIIKYWSGHGYAVRVWALDIGRKGCSIYSIKSDTINGMPVPGRELNKSEDATRIVSPPLI